MNQFQVLLFLNIFHYKTHLEQCYDSIESYTLVPPAYKFLHKLTHPKTSRLTCLAVFNNPNKPKYNPNKARFLRAELLSHLLHLGGGALEELDVSLAQDVLVFLQGVLSVLLA